MAPLTYYKHFLAAPLPEDCSVPEKDAFSITSRSSILTHPLKYSAHTVILLMVGRHYFPPFIIGISLYRYILRDNNCIKIIF